MGINFTGEEAIIGPNGQVVADASWTGGSGCKLTIDNEADANLIAAAPDLLEALNTWLEQYSAEIYEDCPEVVQTRAAIAKATGGQA
jgi:hypothetical protein